MEWVFLFIAVFLETVAILTMKVTPAFKSWGYGALIAVVFLLMLYFESLAVKKIDLTIAYAIWVGSGLVAITLIDYFYFSVKLNTVGFASLFFIVFFMLMLSFKGFNT